MAGTKDEQRQLAPELAALVQVVDALRTTLGRTAEVVVHDFSTPEHSLMAIAGNVTGRSLGAPLTDRLLETYRRYGDAAANVVNVKTRTRTGRLLRSTTIFVRNAAGQIVGSLGINLDQTDHEVAARILGDLLAQEEPQPEQSINFATDVGETMRTLIDDGLAQLGRSPHTLGREERVSFVRTLDARGLFLVRGAVEEVAARLGVSRFTIYGYLDEARKEEQA